MMYPPPRWIRITLCPPWTEKDQRKQEEKERAKKAGRVHFHPQRHNRRGRMGNTDLWGRVKRRNVSVDQHIGSMPGWWSKR
jgi:hypothetical protein